MAWTTPITWTQDQFVVPSDMNAQVSGNLSHVYAQSLYRFRNLLHNGAANVSQRGAGPSAAFTTGTYQVDRWKHNVSGFGAWTNARATDAPTASGLSSSLKAACSTAYTTLANGTFAYVTQSIEGQDVQHLLKGTTSAQALTLSFWVKSTTVGIYIAELTDGTRYCSKAYTVLAANTWEQKTVSFPADTTGTIANNASAGLSLNFWLGGGADYTGGTLQTAWGTAAIAGRATGQVNVGASAANTWQVTGVQLEIGSVQTAFEFMPFGDELRRCQRHYARFAGGGIFSRIGTAIAVSASVANWSVELPVTMRVKPSTFEQSTLCIFDGVSVFAAASFVLDAGGSSADIANGTLAASPLTANRFYQFLNNNSTSGYFAVGAEL